MQASRKKPGIRILLKSSDRANVSRPIAASLRTTGGQDYTFIILISYVVSVAFLTPKCVLSHNKANLDSDSEKLQTLSFSTSNTGLVRIQQVN